PTKNATSCGDVGTRTSCPSEIQQRKSFFDFNCWIEALEGLGAGAGLREKERQLKAATSCGEH
ncbi:hypothetical protein, partial [Mesobacillus foraminis]|uniref:hypothetical protein n=1 Tax=Mesobacillus foraminis TaxID=279826 RepID=UPI001A7E1DF7